MKGSERFIAQINPCCGVWARHSASCIFCQVHISSLYSRGFGVLYLLSLNWLWNWH